MEANEKLRVLQHKEKTTPDKNVTIPVQVYTAMCDVKSLSLLLAIFYTYAWCRCMGSVW